jgi:hypothetical protein
MLSAHCAGMTPNTSYRIRASLNAAGEFQVSVAPLMALKSDVVDVLLAPEQGFALGPGAFIEVPSNAKHGFKNRSQHPVVQLITTTSKLGRFFQEIGRSTTQGEIVGPMKSSAS